MTKSRGSSILTKQSTKDAVLPATEATPVAREIESLAEDETIDFITGRPIRLRGNEEVREQIARSLSAGYGFDRRGATLPGNPEGSR